jgi:hypothetical protein
VLRGGQFHRFSVKSRTVLQGICYEWNSSTDSFVKSGEVLQVPCEEWDTFTGSLLRVGQFYRFFLLRVGWFYRFSVKTGTVLQVLCED